MREYMRRAAFLLSAVFLVAAVTGCSRQDRHDSWTTESGLRVTEVVEGSGGIPSKGDIVSLNYTASYVDGEEFDSSARLGKPMDFLVGHNQMLPGVEEGVQTMRTGGKRILVIPPELAYGKEGRPPVVPPDQWIKFEVELVDIRPGPPPILPWNDAGMEIMVTNSGLQFVDFVEGEGEYPTLGSTVVVQYSGFLDDGTLFDSSYYQGYPLEFELSPETLIPGWVEGLLTMKAGGKRKLIVPPFLGYGSKGFGKTIPPDATLVYNIELLEILP